MSTSTGAPAPRKRIRNRAKNAQNRPQTGQAGAGFAMGVGNGGGAGTSRAMAGRPGMPSHGEPMASFGPRPTGMGISTKSIEGEPVDFILDDLDRLDQREIAMIRYKRNHELFNLIFDSQRIARLEPVPSPYAKHDVQELRNTLIHSIEANERAKVAHLDRIRQWRQELVEQDRALHASAKKLKAVHDARSAAESTTTQVERQWNDAPSHGRIIGVGFVRAQTPEQVQRQPVRPPSPQLDTQSSASITKEEGGISEASAPVSITAPASVPSPEPEPVAPSASTASPSLPDVVMDNGAVDAQLEGQHAALDGALVAPQEMPTQPSSAVQDAPEAVTLLSDPLAQAQTVEVVPDQENDMTATEAQGRESDAEVPTDKGQAADDGPVIDLSNPSIAVESSVMPPLDAGEQATADPSTAPSHDGGPGLSPQLSPAPEATIDAGADQVAVIGALAGNSASPSAI